MTRPILRDVRRREQKPKGPSSWATALRVAVVAVVGGGCAYGASVGIKAFTQGEALPVRTVAVKGAPDGRANEIRTYANIKAGSPLLGVDLDAVSQRVLEHPFVAAAAARRVPPDTIEIEVLARRSAALLSAGSTYVVDDSGHPFKRARPGDALDLPVITGDVVLEDTREDGLEPVAMEADAPAASAAETPTNDVQKPKGQVDVAAVQEALLGLDATVRQPELESTVGRLEEISVERGFGLTFVFASGIRARAGSGLLDSKLARFVRVVRTLREAGHDPAEVYLADERRPERVAVRLRPAPEVASDSGI